MDGDAYIQALTKWIQREGKRLAERNPNPPVAISLHHLYYLLTRIDDLEVPIGPLNIRLEDIGSEQDTSASSSASNYVSFSKRNSDAASIRSVSSIRSVMSTVGSSMWTGFGMFGSAVRSEDQIADDLKQLYSAFCKIPTIRICPNKSMRLITGFEEYPFDTAVPLLAFKNLQYLEISNYAPKQFYGWDQISEQLRSLTVRKCALENVELLILGVIKEELEKKRRKAERGTRYWQAVVDSTSIPGSPRPSTQGSYFSQQRGSMTDLTDANRTGSSGSMSGRPGAAQRKLSRYDRPQSSTPSIGNPAPFVLAPSKWRFLRFLSLADNALTTISVEALAPLAANLNFLDLSKNKFVTIPAALSTLSALRSLDLSKNKIESLHSLLQNPLPGISTLNLRSNKLISIAGIERLPSLERVDLRENLLKDPMEMARLNTAPNFGELWVAGNPFTRTHYTHRTSIFNIFRANAGMTDDITLDGKKPGILEKRTLESRALEVQAVTKPVQNNIAVALQTPATPTKKDSSSIRTVGTPADDVSVKAKKKIHKSRVIDLSSPADQQKEECHPAKEAEIVLRPAKSEQHESMSGEDYRRKIEALRQEVGSGWIRALEEESSRHKSEVLQK